MDFNTEINIDEVEMNLKNFNKRKKVAYLSSVIAAIASVYL